MISCQTISVDSMLDKTYHMMNTWPPVALGPHSILTDCQLDNLKTDAMTAEPAFGLQKQDDVFVRVAHLSPVLRLPPEVLGIIFLYCLPRQRTPTLTEAPLSLTHVCSFWRQVALAMSELWSQLLICLKSSGVVADQNAANLINAWFSNAKQQSLSFSFRGSPLKCEGSPSTLVVDAAFPFMNHCRTLVLRNNRSRQFGRFLALPPGCVEELESLVLDLGGGIPVAGETMTTFSSAPRLRRVCLGLRKISLANMQLPWSQLSHLNMLKTKMNRTTWHQLLLPCEQLVFGAFSVDFGSRSTLSFHDAIVLPNLAHLRIHVIQDTDMCSVFDGLKVPALTTFALVGTAMGRYTQHSPHFLDQLSALRSLTLALDSASADYILLLLNAMPSLTYLQLNVYFLDNWQLLCQRLSHSAQGQQPTYVPQLTHLDICIWEALCDIIEFLKDMVCSRQDPHASHASHRACLETMTLRLPTEIDSASIPIRDRLMESLRIGNVTINLGRELRVACEMIDLPKDPRDWA